VSTILDFPFALPILGGLLIGSAAAMYPVVARRILGASGLVAGATSRGPGGSRMRPLLFLVRPLGRALLATRGAACPTSTSVLRGPARGRRSDGGLQHATRCRMHQRTRRLLQGVAVASITGGDGDVQGGCRRIASCPR